VRVVKVGGRLCREQFDEYTFDSEPPKRVGDEARIRRSCGELVHVMLERGAGKRLWLVAVRRLTAPIKLTLMQAPPRFRRKGKTPQVRANRQARLVAQALKLRQELKQKMLQVKRLAP
jgi:hypothetical protein